jgi:hypothetical protein
MDLKGTKDGMAFNSNDPVLWASTKMGAGYGLQRREDQLWFL